MSVKKIFIFIAVLIMALMVWQLVLGDTGVFVQLWNGTADIVNGIWGAITGDPTAKIMPDNIGAPRPTDLRNPLGTP